MSKIRAITVSTILVALAATASAAVSTCSGVGDGQPIEMIRVVYFGPANLTATDSRANPNSPSHIAALRGWLYYKRAADGTVKDSKVVIFNHGSERERPEPCTTAKNFVNAGYVFFAPLRRGHVAAVPDEPPAGWLPLTSTGVYLSDYQTKCMRTASQSAGADLPHLFCSSAFCRPEVPCTDPNKNNAVEVDYLYRQRTDIRQQIEYIKELPAIGTSGKLANPRRIAIMGHSFGGSAVVLANQFDYGQNVAIAISAAEKSWRPENPFWERDLRNAMEDQARPIYFLAPKNGRSIEPVKTLFGIAVDREYRSQAAIFGYAPCKDEYLRPDGSCDTSEEERWEQAHETFLGQVDIWGPSVRNFIFRNPLPQE